MDRRLHITLVYFGLVEDEAVAEELKAAPLNAWRGTWVALAYLLLLAALWGAARLAGLDVPVVLVPVFAAIVLLLALIEAAAARWRARHPSPGRVAGEARFAVVRAAEALVVGGLGLLGAGRLKSRDLLALALFVVVAVAGGLLLRAWQRRRGAA